MPLFRIHRRMYFDDTDSGGVVYHTHYLRYMEHARSEYLLLRGFGPKFLDDEFNIVFAVTDLQARYLSPARLGDLIEVSAEIQSLKSATVVFKQTASLLDENGSCVRKLVTAEVRVVCLNSKTFKPTRIPSTIEESFLREC
jgi:acyl-CoA thioester hydrolase